MAKIPKFEERGISLDVPLAPSRSPESAGVIDRIQQQTIKAATGAAVAIGGLIEKRQTVKRSDDVANAMNESIKKYYSNRKENVALHSGTDFQGFMEFGQKQFEDISSEFSENLDEEGRRQYNNKLNKFKTTRNIKDSGFETIKSQSFHNNRGIQREDEENDLIFSEADFDLTIDTLDQRKQLRDQSIGVNITDEQAAKRAKGDNKLVTNMLDGMIVRGKGNLVRAKQFLDGGLPQYERMLNELPGNIKRRYSNLINQRLKLEVLEQEKALLTQSSSLGSFLELENKATGHLSANTRRSVENTMDELDAVVQTPKVIQAKNALMNRLNNQEVSQRLLNMHISEASKYDPLQDIKTNNLLEAKDDLETLNHRMKSLQQFMGDVTNDPGKLIQQADVTLEPGTKDFVDAQLARGWPAKSMPKDLMDLEMSIMSTSKDKVSALKDFGQKYPLWSEALHERVAKDKTAVPFALASKFKNNQTKDLILNVNDNLVKKNFIGPGTSDFVIESQVREVLTQVRNAFAKDPEIIDLLQRKLETRTRQLMSPPFMFGSSKAAKTAFDQTVGAEFDFVSVKNSHIAIHKNKGVNLARDVGAMLRSYHRPENRDAFIKDFRIVAAVNDFNGTDKEFIEQHSESFIFQENDSGDGIKILYVDDRLGFRKTLKTIDTLPDRSQIAREINISYDDINNSYGNFQQAALDQLNSEQNKLFPTNKQWKRRLDLFQEKINKDIKITQEKIRAISKAAGFKE